MVAKSSADAAPLPKAVADLFDSKRRYRLTARKFVDALLQHHTSWRQIEPILLLGIEVYMEKFLTPKQFMAMLLKKYKTMEELELFLMMGAKEFIDQTKQEDHARETLKRVEQFLSELKDIENPRESMSADEDCVS